jgi:serine/threonine protein kinase
VLLIAINFTPNPSPFHPEIVLGIPYDPALDIWSVGCTLYELYTGKILLPGRSNNQMLLLMMELKGRFNQKTIKKAKFGDTYFDEMGGFDSIEKDRVTGAVSVDSLSWHVYCVPHPICSRTWCARYIYRSRRATFARGSCRLRLLR